MDVVDALGSVGRGYSTLQLVVSIIVSVGLIAGGIYLIIAGTESSQHTSYVPGPPGSPPIPVPSDVFNSTTRYGYIAVGTLMLIAGITTPFLAWIRRKLIRSNPLIAAAAGALDVAKLIRV
jgi:hypothetical protein